MKSLFIIVSLFPFIAYSQNATTSFVYTGAVQTFTVPCTSTLHIKAWGGGGSGGGADSFGGAVGGAGGCAESDIAVVAGQVITIVVGGGAGPGSGGSGVGGGPSGWGNGVFDGGVGGNAGSSGGSGGGGGGGGGTGVYLGASLIVVAGAGGGGSGGGQFSSGATGGGAGIDGNVSPGSCSSPGISGASGSGVGSGGQNKGGGDGGGGGAGGGGYLGATGGGVAGGCDCGACGGGGGTSWASGTNIVIYNGSGQTPGNATDPLLPAGVAIGGGTSTKGGDGYVTLTYLAPPVADFSVGNTCNDHPMVYTDLSQGSTPVMGAITIINWDWDFGDGSIHDITQNPTHTYVANGPQNVSLIVENNLGCKNTITKIITIHDIPATNLTGLNKCLYGSALTAGFNFTPTDPVVFSSNATIGATDVITQYEWDFQNDGSVDVTTPSAMQNGTQDYLYTLAGNYTIKLKVSTAFCSKEQVVPITIYPNPVLAFTANNGCQKDTKIQFNNTSTNGLGTAGNLVYAWNLDPTISLLTNPSQVYNTAGTKTIDLVAYDVNNCFAKLTSTIKIYPKPVADFAITNVCMNVANIFTDASVLTIPAGFNDVVTNYNWTYNTLVSNTTNATTQNTTHIYTFPATQLKPIAALVVITNNNCSDTVTKSVIVWTLPKAKYTMSAPCYPNPIVFTNLSTLLVGTDNSTMATMSINWGDGQTQAITGLTQIANHNHNASGNYISELNVESNHGCKDKLQVPITIHAKPVASYTTLPNQGCEPLCVTFTNSSSQNESPVSETIIKNEWQFNDYNLGKATDDKSTNKNTVHCYDNPTDTNQTHIPQLIVTTNTGCKDTLVSKVEVYPLPKANFNIMPQVVDMLNPEVKITDQSHLATTIIWNYGNDFIKQMSNSNPLNPIRDYVYTYSDSGSYVIKQTVITDKGCRDSISNIVQVNPIYTVYVPNVFTPNGDGLNDYFMVRGINIKELNLVVFNRYGEVIERITDPKNKGWDGTDIRESKICKQEVYNWKMEYTDVFNVKHRGTTGTVTLIK